MFTVEEDHIGGFSVAGRAHIFGALAVAVPGIVGGLARIQERCGSLSLEATVQPAVDAARHGYWVDAWTALGIQQVLLPNAAEYPTALRDFSIEDRPAREGESLANPDLASTLEEIGKKGAEVFYRGRHCGRSSAARAES
jgi:gamma-glutamyltranspeptidase/glutathione hydrolase